jgi:hypothetical protein
MFFVLRQLSTIEEQKQEQNCLFRRGDYRIKVYNPKLSWVRVPVKMFRNNFSYNIQRSVSNDQAYGKLSGNKD